jgi:hypothetical protein
MLKPKFELPIPPPLHRGVDELPFVSFGDYVMMHFPQIDIDRGL